MPTREQLLAINDELRRLKAGGQRSVAVTEESLAMLRESVDICRSGFMPDAPSASAIVSGVKPDLQIIQPGAPRAPVAPTAPALPATPMIELPVGDKQARWNYVRDLVLNDKTCLSHVYAGKKAVFGVGNLDARIMFVGEAPGGDEEDQGEPFVGRAGQLLNKMIKAMGLERGQVYIGNILNWRPEMPRNPDGSQTGNRPPTAQEMAYCLPFIRAQIAIIQPKVLVALGKTAVDGLLGADRFKSMGAARGSWHQYADTPLRASYHPSYLLRQEGLTSATAKKIKRDAWEDMLAVMERAEIPVSEKQRNYFL